MSIWTTNYAVERLQDALLACEAPLSDLDLEAAIARGKAAERALQRRRTSRAVERLLPLLKAEAARERSLVLKMIKGSHMSADRSDMHPSVRIAVDQLLAEGRIEEVTRRDGKTILQVCTDKG